MEIKNVEDVEDVEDVEQKNEETQIGKTDKDFSQVVTCLKEAVIAGVSTLAFGWVTYQVSNVISAAKKAISEFRNR